MAAFDVDPDDLRAAATTVDGIVRSATSTTPAPALPDAGHAGLAEAITTFRSATATSWTARLGATSSVASALRRSASVFEGADADGVADLRSRQAVIT